MLKLLERKFNFVLLMCLRRRCPLPWIHPPQKILLLLILSLILSELGRFVLTISNLFFITFMFFWILQIQRQLDEFVQLKSELQKSDENFEYLQNYQLQSNYKELEIFLQTVISYYDNQFWDIVPLVNFLDNNLTKSKLTEFQLFQLTSEVYNFTSISLFLWLFHVILIDLIGRNAYQTIWRFRSNATRNVSSI